VVAEPSSVVAPLLSLRSLKRVHMAAAAHSPWPFFFVKNLRNPLTSTPSGRQSTVDQQQSLTLATSLLGATAAPDLFSTSLWAPTLDPPQKRAKENATSMTVTPPLELCTPLLVPPLGLSLQLYAMFLERFLRRKRAFLLPL